MLRAALGILYRGDDAAGTVLVGTVLTGLSAGAVLLWVGILAVSPPVGLAVTPGLLLPGLLLRGYVLRVAAAGVAMRPAAPSFVQWGSLVRGGLRSSTLAAGHFLPAVVLAVITGGAFAVGAAAASEGSGSLVVPAAIVGLLGLLGVVCVGGLTLYVWPAAHAVLATTGSLRRSLNPLRTGRIAFSSEYAIGWLLAGGVFLGVPALIVPVVALGVLIGLLNPIVAFVWLLACFLLAVSLWFFGRTSAAWIIGRSAAVGLATSAARSAVDTATPNARGRVPVPANRSTSPPDDSTSAGRSTITPALQVGRGVDTGTEPAASPIGDGTCRLYPPLSLPAEDVAVDEDDATESVAAAENNDAENVATAENDDAADDDAETTARDAD